ncbi:variable large family protein [Borrelia hispanica]|uniref:variable large family protein n=1 Tax=Borrelia hispanica TaxID=40835 RepID=UPI001F16DD00|nr:variable large family protein [Borrelia hispanica]
MMVMVMVVMMGCNSGGVAGGEGKVNLEAKNSFLESLVKIGEGFQEIFVGFGSAIGDVLGFNAVKSDDNRSKVGEHFKTIGDGLKNTKDKLAELGKEIVAVPNADTKGVEAVIQSSSAVISKLIDSVTKLVGVTKEGNTDIGDNAAGAAVPAGEANIKVVIAEVRDMIDIAEKSGVKIDAGTAGGEVAAGANTAPAVLSGDAAAAAGDAAKLAAEVSKADPWAMIDKIKNAKTKTGALTAGANNNAGELATGGNVANGAKAATNADLAAAVALRAMTKSGKFSANNADTDVVKAAAASAVNKVLGVLDIIIRKIVNLELGKIKDAVKGIQYSETTGINVPEAGTTQIPATK